jgi:hypothetical protein
MTRTEQDLREALRSARDPDSERRLADLIQRLAQDDRDRAGPCRSGAERSTRAVGVARRRGHTRDERRCPSHSHRGSRPPAGPSGHELALPAAGCDPGG